MSAISIEEAYEKWGDELIGYATAVTGRTAAKRHLARARAALRKVLT